MTADRGWALARDVALAAAVAALAVTDAALSAHRLAALDYALLLAGTLVIAVRRRAPRTVLVISLVLILAYTARVGPGPIATVPVLIAIYTVTAAGHRILAASVTVPLIVIAVASNLAKTPGDPAGQAIQAAILPVGWFVASFVLGEVSRHRRAFVAEAQERARDAERTREAVALRRADEERLRIARELHDSLTHTISVIKVQAGVAVHLARKRGEEVPEALVAVEDASQEAMRELRATLEVLRGPGEDGGYGLDRLPALIERAATAGPPATMTVEGQRGSVPPAVDRAAYRIVQEALTNVAKHANATAARVTIGYTPGMVAIRVEDDGTAAAGDGIVPGMGLAGMRERVTALGGCLNAAPRPGGGFSVTAELPLEGAR
ncbi:sensor histidine kinase [Amycolatopsis alkalitolerans]|uniref:histidine kinase n=1 Tax=Amycolatopsis alkalitolerans TaxID=2547244 RepID=A0A5C4LQ16_9PSEU|nr:sensor histidine kinase [Amycolatopsis alkalitolerans]TNC20199.1 sensor histidine kinase [Amycolatopsis alkalitolerans]